jgi:hypothetical protein
MAPEQSEGVLETTHRASVTKSRILGASLSMNSVPVVDRDPQTDESQERD